jgi:hypothetical protein
MRKCLQKITKILHGLSLFILIKTSFRVRFGCYLNLMPSAKANKRKRKKTFPIIIKNNKTPNEKGRDEGKKTAKWLLYQCFRETLEASGVLTIFLFIIKRFSVHNLTMFFHHAAITILFGKRPCVRNFDENSSRLAVKTKWWRR